MENTDLILYKNSKDVMSHSKKIHT